MTDLGMDTLDTAVQKVNTLLNDIQDDLGWTGSKSVAYNVLRAALHALRDRLPVNEAANFAAQLPLILKGTFYEGWQPEKVPVKMDRAGFVGRVREELSVDSAQIEDSDIEQLIRVVLTDLFIEFNPQEAERLKQVLPSDLEDFLIP